MLKEVSTIVHAIQSKNDTINTIHNDQTNLSDMSNYRMSSFRSYYMEHSELLKEKTKSELELTFLKLVREQESRFKEFASTEGTRRVATITSLCENERENIIRITTGEGTKMKKCKPIPRRTIGTDFKNGTDT